MRIACFHNLPSGGAKRATVELARQLRQAGDVVDLFLPSTADEGFLPSSEYADSVRAYPAWSSAGTSGDSTIGLLRRAPALALVLLNAHHVQRRIAAEIDASGYDLVMVHPCRFTQAPFVLRHLATPSVYFCQEPLRRAYEKKGMSPMSRLSMWAPVIGPARSDRENIRYATRILANSHYSRESIKRIYGLDATVTYLGVDTGKFVPGPPDRADYVLSVGAIDRVKGHTFVLESLGRIPQERRPRLIIVGDRAVSGEPDAIREAAERWGVELDLRIRVSESELIELYRNARLLLVAANNEPFGLTPLEAAACGTPVVGIKEAGLRESIIEAETGILVDKRVPQQFADAVDGLLSDPAAWRAMSSRAVELIRVDWTWEQAGIRVRRELLLVAERAASAGSGSSEAIAGMGKGSPNHDS